MAKAFLVSAINPDTGMTLYLDSECCWIGTKQGAQVFTRHEADAAIARIEYHNRQMDAEDRLYPTLEGIRS